MNASSASHDGELAAERDHFVLFHALRGAPEPDLLDVERVVLALEFEERAPAPSQA
jgi:hypothetical protein